MSKTTKAEFELFRREVEKWLDLFDITGWDTTYAWETMDREALAGANHNLTARQAIFLFSRKNEDDYKTKISHAAHHEALEALLAELDVLARRRTFDEDSWIAARHRVINNIQSAFAKITKQPGESV